MKKALITGITGQDGSYLAELLLEKGYEVHGLRRRSSSFNTERIDHLRQIQQDNNKAKLFLHFGDMTDSANLIRLVNEIKPDEIYNLAAQSHVHISFDIPEYTANGDGVGTLRLLEAIRIAGIEKTCRFYQASTSEMFGGVGHNMPSTGYTEESHFYPRSPYGAAKLYAHWITKNYYESYGIYACCGILFNHESPRRGENFVTRKITMAVAKIKFGLQEKLFIGNMYAKRDRGHAKDYVEGMRRMLQQSNPQDYVLATGETYTVKEFIERSFEEIGIKIIWKGEGVEEKGYNEVDGKCLVEIDPIYFRPAEVELLLGDASKAKKELSWSPHYDAKTLCKEMIQSDLKKLQK